MIVGNKERFAIEAEVGERVEGWVFGKLRFWLCSKPVGDWADAVDLNGCVRWLRDFAEHPRDRFELGLFERTPEEVFARVFDSVMAGSATSASAKPVADAYARFHISHLGMSSFERFELLLLKDEHGGERCLWREAGSPEILECRMWRNEMERVSAEFCDRFQIELRSG